MEHPAGKLETIDDRALHHFVLKTEKWRNFMLNLGFELNQLKKMKTICEDATIKVRRLVHNFEERMNDTREQVWDENCNLREDFSFTGIATAGLRDIILLHDWWAANASGKTYEDIKDGQGDLVFKNEDEFMAFRKRCNKIAYNLRKNQYAQLLATKRVKIQDLIAELQDKRLKRGTLQYPDKYGWEAKKDEEKPWSIDDVTDEQAARVRLLASADKVLAEQEKQTKQYNVDSSMMVDRTVSYLKGLGLIESEADIESLCVRSNAAHARTSDLDTGIDLVDRAKKKLDAAKENLINHRASLQTIIDKVDEAERKIQELQKVNDRIFKACLVERNQRTRNRLLIEKMENESKIMDLKGVVKKTRKKHLSDFSSLERMRQKVDDLQGEYDLKVKDFKEGLGVNPESVEQLMTQIYNKFQDEILEHDIKKTRKQK